MISEMVALKSGCKKEDGRAYIVVSLCVEWVVEDGMLIGNVSCVINHCGLCVIVASRSSQRRQRTIYYNTNGSSYGRTTSIVPHRRPSVFSRTIRLARRCRL